MADFLFEIGLEEIPARMIKHAEDELVGLVMGLLINSRLFMPQSVLSPLGYSTPRRLATYLSGIQAKEPDRIEQLLGPPWSIAFKNGEPTSAALAFAKKAGTQVSDLRRISTPRGEYVAASVEKEGLSAKQVILDGLPRALEQIYWAKSMYWREGKPERFVRPVRWMLALFDGEIVPVEFAGITAANRTYGHRVLYGDTPIEIATPGEYVTNLEAAFVLPEVAARRHRIRKQLDRVTRTVPGARWREDEPLVETVTQLTEWPSVLLGGFDPEYLDLPEEVLVTVMRDHQKYFAVEDEGGKLLPHFLTVLNTQVGEAGQAIIRHGNERVLRARFNDARFFWNYDQKIPLAERVDLLKNVTFQKDLGSYWEKTQTNLRLAEALAGRMAERDVAFDQVALRQAVLLAKADLTAEMVKEFTELQGIVGGLYARAQGYGEAAAEAIYWQYRPASTDDAAPPTIEGKLLGLADRMATIADMFALGLEPTGSKDPFALRRAANAVIKILAGGELPLSLSELEVMATSPAQNGLAETATAAIAGFLRERLEFFLRDVLGLAYDVVKAVLAAAADDVPDAIARAGALTEVRGSEDFLAISSAFKRIKNILRQAAERGDMHATVAVAEAFQEPHERELHARAQALAPEVEALRAQRRYREALERIATLRPVIDAFFDKVMVMAPDEALRRNRLALVAEVLGNFSRIADFSEIVVS